MDLDQPINQDPSHQLADVLLIEHVVSRWVVLHLLSLHAECDLLEVLRDLLAVLRFSIFLINGINGLIFYFGSDFLPELFYFFEVCWVGLVFGHAYFCLCLLRDVGHLHIREALKLWTLELAALELSTLELVVDHLGLGDHRIGWWEIVTVKVLLWWHANQALSLTWMVDAKARDLVWMVSFVWHAKHLVWLDLRLVINQNLSLGHLAHAIWSLSLISHALVSVAIAMCIVLLSVLHVLHLFIFIDGDHL